MTKQSREAKAKQQARRTSIKACATSYANVQDYTTLSRMQELTR